MSKPILNPKLNDRFGKLVVIDETVTYHKGGRLIKCLCDCGKEKHTASKGYFVDWIKRTYKNMIKTWMIKDE